MTGNFTVVLDFSNLRKQTLEEFSPNSSNSTFLQMLLCHLMDCIIYYFIEYFIFICSYASIFMPLVGGGGGIWALICFCLRTNLGRGGHTYELLLLLRCLALDAGWHAEHFSFGVNSLPPPAALPSSPEPATLTLLIWFGGRMNSD